MTEPLLQVSGLSKHYELPARPFQKPQVLHALSDVSFHVNRRETVAIIGESGCGKSTLARVLTLMEPPTAGGFHFEGKPQLYQKNSFNKNVGMVFQNPYSSLNPRQSIGSSLTEPLVLAKVDNRKQAKQQALAMMERVDLNPALYDRYPHMLSGGQRQRVAIARALMLQPRALVLDEPVSALDVSVQAQVLNLLSRLKTEFDSSYIFISHDLSVVRHISQKIIVMYLGRIVEFGDTESIFSNPSHPYTLALIDAAPRVEKERRTDRYRLQGELPSPLNLPSGCAFHLRCRYRQAKCRQIRPELTAHQRDNQVACHFPVSNQA